MAYFDHNTDGAYQTRSGLIVHIKYMMALGLKDYEYSYNKYGDVTHFRKLPDGVITAIVRGRGDEHPMDLVRGIGTKDGERHLVKEALKCK